MKLAKIVWTLVMMFVLVENTSAATLKDKVITYSTGSYLAGQVIPLGVDLYGYNYQAHTFSGSYFNAYANSDNLPPYLGDDEAYLAANPTAASHWAWPYRNDQLSMKWNEAWLSNEDQDNDGKLDRHFGHSSYIGSGAWVNNHQNGVYTILDEEFSWNYFVKIVAVPSDAVNVAGVWFDANGVEIGPVIWGEFALVQDVYNDRGAGFNGVSYHSPAGPGVGKY